MANEIDKTVEYYRDNLNRLMRWGTIAFFAIAGWLMSGPPSGGRISFCKPPGSAEYERALGLLVLCAVGWPMWFISVVVAKYKCKKYV